MAGTSGAMPCLEHDGIASGAPIARPNTCSAAGDSVDKDKSNTHVAIERGEGVINFIGQVRQRALKFEFSKPMQLTLLPHFDNGQDRRRIERKVLVVSRLERSGIHQSLKDVFDTVPASASRTQGLSWGELEIAVLDLDEEWLRSAERETLSMLKCLSEGDECGK